MSPIPLAIRGEQFRELLPFEVARHPRDAEAEGLSQTSRVIGSGLSQKSLGERLRRFDERFVVERDERLQRRVGGSAFDAGEVGVGAVERDEVRMRCRSFEERVHASAIAVLAGAVCPFEVAGVTEVRDTSRQRREDARPADLLRQDSGDIKTEIADDFGFDAQPILPSEQRVLRIDFKQFIAMRRGLPIRRGQDDQLDECLA